MLLGTVIKQAMRAQGAFVEAMAERDPRLARRIEAEAGRLGISARDLIADSVRSFMAAEDNEGWTTIVSGIQRSEDAGAAFLEAVMRMRLSHRCSHLNGAMESLAEGQAGCAR